MTNQPSVNKHHLPSIRLKPGRDKALRSGHPWIFSGALNNKSNSASDGDLVAVESAQGDFLGCGHFADGSIAIRLLSLTKISSEETFLTQVLAQASTMRRGLGLSPEFANQLLATTGWRLINAEGDGLPGLTIDLYQQTAVIQCHSAGMNRLRPAIAEILSRNHAVTQIIDRSPDSDKMSAAERIILGDSGVTEILENGIRFEIDCLNGQKTGFFLDQRENRTLVERYSSGRRVLNTFCYSGGFSLYALRGGAKSVCSVDSSSPALESLARNFSLNSFSSEQSPTSSSRTVKADCLQYLTELDSAYDLIILDPPAFVKHRGALKGGLKGYESINYNALRQIEAGGILFTFSCSPFVSADQLLDAVRQGAFRAKREIQILHTLGAAPCHPLNPNHPEGQYLKGFALFVR